VLVTVVDVNDNKPVFSELIYYGAVTERAAVDSVVMVVLATDDDELVNNVTFVTQTFTLV